MINILTLAAPGVLFGALLLGIIFKVFLGYGEEDMTWWGVKYQNYISGFNGWKRSQCH